MPRKKKDTNTGPACYYKATRPDGTDFQTGTIDYGAALVSGGVVHHPYQGRYKHHASQYISISTAPADCTGFSWPCRLFRVEPEGDVWTPEPQAYPNKRAVSALRVVEELPAWQAFGPNGEQVVELLTRCQSLNTHKEAQVSWSTPQRKAAWDAALDAAQGAARFAAWDSARVAVWKAASDSAWDSAWNSAVALVVRDLITPEQFEILYRPWREAIGVPA